MQICVRVISCGNIVLYSGKKGIMYCTVARRLLCTVQWQEGVAMYCTVAIRGNLVVYSGKECKLFTVKWQTGVTMYCTLASRDNFVLCRGRGNNVLYSGKQEQLCTVQCQSRGQYELHRGNLGLYYTVQWSEGVTM